MSSRLLVWSSSRLLAFSSSRLVLLAAFRLLIFLSSRLVLQPFSSSRGCFAPLCHRRAARQRLEPLLELLLESALRLALDDWGCVVHRDGQPQRHRIHRVRMERAGQALRVNSVNRIRTLAVVTETLKRSQKRTRRTVTNSQTDKQAHESRSVSTKHDVTRMARAMRAKA